MDAFDAYVLALALKRHFTPNGNYDYIKYNGKIKASKTSFDTRSDKYFFHKLSKKSDPEGFLIANYVKHGSNIWIGDLVGDQKYDDTYKEWLKKKESISYIFKNDFEQISESLDANLKVVDGQYPKLLELYMRGKINIETIIILDKLLHILVQWKNNIQDVALWPDIYSMCIKYTPFVSYDEKKIKKIIFETL